MVGRKVVSREGISLLHKDTCLTKTYINHLLSWGVRSLYINDGVDAKEEFIEKYEDVIKTVKPITADIRQSGQIPVKEMHKLAD